MEDKKLKGSFYTPKILSDFLMSYIIEKYLTKYDLAILEPSCGDGQFISSFFSSLDIGKLNKLEIDLIDIDVDELFKASKNIPNDRRVSINSVCDDYLKQFIDHRKKYDLIFGNPPYIRKKNMKKTQIEVCETVHEIAKKTSKHINSKAKINNIWTAFVEAAIFSIKEEGIICLVIPAEIMQVNYAEEIRTLIQNEFDKVEIFAFNELIFEGIQQDVVAIIGVKGITKKSEHGFSFYQVNALSDLKEPRFTEKHSNIHRTTLDKWTNYILSDDDLNFVEKLKDKYYSINNYCDKISAGIVTAANDYFIISPSDVIKKNLHNNKEVIKPILPKGSAVPNLINFTEEDLSLLLNSDKRVNFIHFPDIPFNEVPENLRNYILEGEKNNSKKGELDKRFKMTKRKYWYHVPNTWISESLFIKRCDEYPKIILNSAGVHATDSFYRIVPKPNFKMKNIIFSFYNSLTMALAELEGRFYGGGVLELTPNEFKNLIIPYNPIVSDEQFLELDKMFRNKESLQNILNYTDNILLKNTPQHQLNRLREIRIKLVNRRLKNTSNDEDSLINTISDKEKAVLEI